MDDRDMRELLRGYLDGLDWSRGVAKTDLLARLGDDEALRNVVGQYASEGIYFSPDDLLTVIPEQAWQAAQGDAWRGGSPPDDAAERSRFLASPAASEPRQPPEATGPDAAGALRRTAAEPAQTGDRVVSITSKPDDGSLAASAAPAGNRRRAASVGLSAVLEGLGQAYNRQPRKALGFAAVGLTLSTLSGLNTWIVRHVFRARGARIGPTRIRPALLGLWAATYSLNLWDAWRNARPADARRADPAAATPPSTTWDDLRPDRAGPPSPSDGTDEFPTVGT